MSSPSVLSTHILSDNNFVFVFFKLVIEKIRVFLIINIRFSQRILSASSDNKFKLLLKPEIAL